MGPFSTRFRARKNRPRRALRQPRVISPDALALVRFSCARPTSRILNTIKVVDALLRVKLPQGPCWYRYNRMATANMPMAARLTTGWTAVALLAGERAHYRRWKLVTPSRQKNCYG